MHTFLTPDPIVLEIRNAAGEVRIDLADTATTTVELTAGSAHPFEFLDDMLRSVGGLRSKGFPPGSGPAEMPDQDPYEEDPTERVRVDLRDGTDGGPATLIIDTDPARNGWRTSFSIRVAAPQASGVRVQTQSANVAVSGEADRVELRTASGDVSVDRVAGRAVVQTASGDVAISSCFQADVRTASGEVSVRETAGDTILHTTSGDVRVERPAGDLTARSVSGDVRLPDVTSGRVEAITVSGDVEIGVHAGSLAAIDLNTVSGATQSDLEVSDDVPQDSGDDGPTLDIRVKTTSGDIRLRRAVAV